ncbi:MAG: MinD/ParA family protein [Actinomycetota bacterium]|nr:MinD/ParA family protein [Actinomycetota bacterium]
MSNHRTEPPGAEGDAAVPLVDQVSRNGPQRREVEEEAAHQSEGPPRGPVRPAPQSSDETLPSVFTGPPSTTADVFSDEMLLRGGRPPVAGWRRVAWRLSGGRLRVPLSARERRELELVARIKARAAGPRHIVVLSRKGGVGKTTVTAMVGAALASVRGDRVISVDCNPDAGSLAHRIHRETPATITNVLASRRTITRYADLRAYTSQGSSRLEVLASDDDPRISEALTGEDYLALLDLLDNHYNVILADTGTGILDSGIQGLLREADQLVVVSSPAIDGGRVAAATLDWLDSHGYRVLRRKAVAVINGVRRSSLVDLDAMEGIFEQRCRAVVRVPWDPQLEVGGEISLDEVAANTRQAFLEIAAAIAEGFKVRSPAAHD